MTLNKAAKVIVQSQREEQPVCIFGICDGSGFVTEGEVGDEFEALCSCEKYRRAETKGEMQFELARGN